MTADIPRGFFDLPNAEVLQRAAAIRLLVLDVDGVLTDGTVYMGAQGELLKAFHIHDGKGISMLLGAGIEVALLTARQGDAVLRRAEELRIRHVLQGRDPKWPALQELLDKLEIAPSQTAYIGDDLVDLPVLRRVGLGMAVANAHPWITEHCHWLTRRPGGRGAVREACELILAAQGKLSPIFEHYAQI